MKIKLPTFWSVFTVLFLLPAISLFAQVGINTTTPNGILDVNSSNQGLVLPRLALTATNEMAPAANPQTGNIPVGTTIYNTNSTSTGENDVYPGIYFWSGSEWLNQFTKKDIEIVKQTQNSTGYRPKSSDDYKDIPNLGSQNFVPKYSGTYKIEVSMNYGSGAPVSKSDLRVVAQQGNFKFSFNGVDKIINVKAFSTKASPNSGGGQDYFLIWEQNAYVTYKTLVAGQTYNFRLQFDQLDAPEFSDSGNSDGDFAGGSGYIGFDIPCSVEFLYLDE